VPTETILFQLEVHYIAQRVANNEDKLGYVYNSATT